MTTHIRVPDSEYDIGLLVRSKRTELNFDTLDSMPTGNSATELTREVKNLNTIYAPQVRGSVEECTFNNFGKYQVKQINQL